ncbi:unnamed protein product [Coregonus sp. 'balchen']|nr:unnamed protein product [Coregonus sp. 'balchen']
MTWSSPSTKWGAEIANQALKAVVEAAKAGETVVSLCAKGDAFIMAETGKVFRKEKDLKKGIAFPTSVSVNNCVCHFSPLKSDPEIVLKDGDLIKIDLGVHVDGFISNLAHSFVVGVTKEAPLTGRKADVIKAAHLCAEAALRLNSQVTEAWNKIAKSFKCSAIEGKDHEKAEFEVHEVYAVDVLISTGEGKAKDAGQRTTIYKRDPDKQYGLKMKTSRSFFSEVERRFDAMPFTLRAFEDEGEFVAQFKFTVLLMANGPLRITTELYEPELYKSEHEVEDADLKASKTVETETAPGHPAPVKVEETEAAE